MMLLFFILQKKEKLLVISDLCNLKKFLKKQKKRTIIKLIKPISLISKKITFSNKKTPIPYNEIG